LIPSLQTFVLLFCTIVTGLADQNSRSDCKIIKLSLTDL
jgi:hypothetical protein